MMRPLCLSIVIATTVLQLSACDDGTQAETAAAIARDSSLKHDLQLATGDTAAAAGLDTKAPASVPPMVEGRGGLTVTQSSGSIEPSPTVSPTLASNPRPVDAESFAGPSCASPALTDQRRCLLSYLARSDAPLDKTYQTLITALKREASGGSSGREPPTVVRLRTAQRNWLVYRDDECRKRTIDSEGPLWAPVRAKCLAEYSALRTRELSDALAKRPAIATQTKAQPRSKATAAKRTSSRKSSRARKSRSR